MRRLLFTLATMGALFIGVPNRADAALIGTLTGSTTLTLDDKTFSDFTCSFSGTNVLGTCSTVDVTTGLDAFGNIGLVFQLNASAFSDGTFLSTGDYQIGYTVTATGATITDIHLSFNGAVSGAGLTDVSETVRNGATVVGNILVTNPPPVLDASADLTGGPYQTLTVLKDIQFGITGGQAGRATISQAGQYFSQVPEPASLALFGFAALGAAARRRIRKNAAV